MVGFVLDPSCALPDPPPEFGFLSDPLRALPDLPLEFQDERRWRDVAIGEERSEERGAEEKRLLGGSVDESWSVVYLRVYPR